MCFLNGKAFWMNSMYRFNDLTFICYNWMPCVADHVLDLQESFYRSAGVSRLHSSDTFDPSKVQDGDLIFVKTDFIFNGI